MLNYVLSASGDCLKMGKLNWSMYLCVLYWKNWWLPTVFKCLINIGCFLVSWFSLDWKTWPWKNYINCTTRASKALQTKGNLVIYWVIYLWEGSTVESLGTSNVVRTTQLSKDIVGLFVTLIQYKTSFWAKSWLTESSDRFIAQANFYMCWIIKR